MQAAGFNVYVHENRLTGNSSPFNLGNSRTYLGNASLTGPAVNTYAEDPNNYMLVPATYALNKSNTYLGNASLSGVNYPSDLIVNNILSEDDEQYRAVIEDSTTQEEWMYTFFVGGQTKGTSATIDIDRKSEFRRLLLELKPIGMYGILQINYL